MVVFGQLSSLLLILKIRPIGCPETSVTIYQSTLRNIPEERRTLYVLRLVYITLCDSKRYKTCVPVIQFEIRTRTKWSYLSHIHFLSQRCFNFYNYNELYAPHTGQILLLTSHLLPVFPSGVFFLIFQQKYWPFIL